MYQLLLKVSICGGNPTWQCSGYFESFEEARNFQMPASSTIQVMDGKIIKLSEVMDKKHAYAWSPIACDRCKQELIFSTTDGNCQSPCRYKFSTVGIRTSIFHGLMIPLLNGWEGNLCDQCLLSLNSWFYKFSTTKD